MRLNFVLHKVRRSDVTFDTLKVLSCRCHLIFVTPLKRSFHLGGMNTIAMHHFFKQKKYIKSNRKLKFTIKYQKQIHFKVKDNKLKVKIT